jgi:hypothetical protein
LADLLTATAYARDFFLTVLASVEPGYYLVSDHSFDSDGAARVAPHLIRLDSEQPTEAGKLREYFAERLDLSPTLLDALVTQQLPNVVNLKVGRYVKPLESRIEFDAAGVKRLNIGSEIEKVVALNILGLRDIGVQKYEFQAPEAMAGSAYDYPTTRKFTLELFRSWLVDKGPKAPVEFVMKNGVRNSLPAPASYNKDLRMSAIEVAALELVGNNDTSMADRLRICNSNDLRCNVAESSNIQKVDFVGSNGVSAYRALQTPEGDSIAYQIVKNAAALSKRRDDFAKATREHAGEDAEKLRNQALQQVGSVERLRKHIDALLNTLDETRVFRASITDPASSDSAWSLLSQYVAKSRTTSDAEALEIRANVLGKIDAAVVKVVELHNALGPKEGVCDAPAPSAADGVVAAREISSDDGDDLASSAAAAQNGQHVAPDHMPVPSASDITNISNASNASSSSSVVQDCNTTPAAVRRKAIETLNIELSQLKEVVNQVFEFTMSSSIAPLVLKKMNDEVSRAEAEIQLLNKLLSFQPVN